MDEQGEVAAMAFTEMPDMIVSVAARAVASSLEASRKAVSDMRKGGVPSGPPVASAPLAGMQAFVQAVAKIYGIQQGMVVSGI